MLSAATLELLRDAIAARWDAFVRGEAPAGDADAVDLRLGAALAAAAAEARQHAMPPERLLVQLKAVEASVVAGDRRTPSVERERFHVQLVLAMLRAYFPAPGA